MIPLRTRRLVIRPIERSDADALFALFNDEQVVRFLSSPPWPYRHADAEAFIDMVIAGKAPDSEVVFAICRDGDFLGCIGHRSRQASHHLQSGAGPNIGYWLGRVHWGQGIMTEAVRALVAHLFADKSFTAIYSGAFSENAASLRVQDKAGFVKEGETMLHSRPRRGEYPHTNTVLTRARYEALAR